MKYLSYYDIPENKKENRSIALAATNKMTYICEAMNKAGCPIEIISASATLNRKGCKGKVVRISENTTLRLFSSMGTGNLLKRLLGRYLLKAKLFFYLLCNTKKEETVLVYHSVFYADMVRALKKIKKFKLILEVEEIYADVTGREQDRPKELKLFSTADAYIFPTELLHRKINKNNKPYAVIYGTYHVEPERNNQSTERALDSKIHCVYAGTFDPRKGCVAAAEAAKYLSERYHIHIIGFGKQEDVNRIKQLTQTLSEECRCGISYDGCLKGEEYINFIQSCQVGLSPQDPTAEFNDTSFPSKVLSYMANGLRVVSVRIPSIELSDVGELIHFYDEQTPEAIAEAVMGIQFDDGYDSRAIISKLDKQFVEDLKVLLEK